MGPVKKTVPADQTTLYCPAKPKTTYTCTAAPKCVYSYNVSKWSEGLDGCPTCGTDAAITLTRTVSCSNQDGDLALKSTDCSLPRPNTTMQCQTTPACCGNVPCSAADAADPTKEVVKKVKMKLNIDLHTIGGEGTESRIKFEADFARDVASALGIVASRIIVNSIVAGSVVVDFSIRPDSAGAPISTAVITGAFGQAGVAIAGTTTAAGISALSISSEVVTKPPPPTPSPTPLQEDNGVHPAFIIVPSVGAVVLLVLAICFVPGDICDRVRDKIGIGSPSFKSSSEGFRKQDV